MQNLERKNIRDSNKTWVLFSLKLSMHIHHLVAIKYVFLFWCDSELIDPLWHICEDAVLSSTELTFSPEVATHEVIKTQHTSWLALKRYIWQLKPACMELKIINPKSLHIEIKNCISLVSFQTYLQNMWSHFVETGSCTTSKLQKGKQKQEHRSYRNWGVRIQTESLLFQHLSALNNYRPHLPVRDKRQKPHTALQTIL